MLFSSIPFLYYFLPVVILLYFIVPFKFKNLVLLAASLFFYFYGEPVYVVLMVVSSISAYIHGLLIHKYKGTKLSKVFLITSVVIGLSGLLFFKYTDFFIGNVNSIFGANIGLLGLALPIGISFYTFQTISYTIDVYRGNAQVQKNFIHLATYVSLFPQLIAGPIVRYTTVEEDLNGRKHSFEQFSSGVFRFAVGLAKKVIIADSLGTFCNAGQIFRSVGDQSVVLYWLYAIAYCLQIYYDFSGYSDMAIGLGRMFGFRFLENFNYPFISKSVSEFWRRWHMSLGSWFRDYVYIPLGGNKVSKIKWFRNVLVVWFLTGFWHGADWTFIIWGLYFALFLLMEKLFLAKFLEKMPSFVSHIYVFFVMIISFVIFNGNGISGSLSDLGGMFGALNIPFVNETSLYYLRSYAPMLLIAAIGATPVVKNLAIKMRDSKKLGTVAAVLQPVVMVVFLVIVTAYLVDGSANFFLYFDF
ncbi:MAG: MBOAT family protein [Clostridia bacterium]|nr:MBOAT family protein [Clostridia bacterium]